MNEPVTPELFVEAWMRAYKEGHGKTWIAESLKISYQAVTSRALYYRKNGIKLPVLYKSRSGFSGTVNVDELNRFIEGELK